MLQKMFGNFDVFHKKIKKDFKGLTRIHCWLSLFWCMLRYGCSPRDYCQFDFFRKSSFERRSFLTLAKQAKMIHRLNDVTYKPFLQDKVKFNQYFKAYIHRDWLAPDCTFEEFAAFVKNHAAVIVKPMDGRFGKGVWKYVFCEQDRLEEVYESARGALVEEALVQHDEMAKLNPTSVNAVRVVTLYTTAQIHIVACSLRTGGAEGCVDNLHAGGVCAGVDPEKGIVNTDAVNFDLERTMFHPVTHELLTGFCIPNWDDVLRTVGDAAASLPQVRYIGWDVAVLPEGAALIEGNFSAACDIIQMIDLRGKSRYIRELEKNG